MFISLSYNYYNCIFVLNNPRDLGKGKFNIEKVSIIKCDLYLLIRAFTKIFELYTLYKKPICANKILL